jgi:hypothetical protein
MMADGGGFVVVLVLGVLLVVGVLVLSAYQHRRRQEAITAWALARGWRRVPADPALVTRWRGKPFGTGDRRRIGETIEGTYRGRPARSFAYSYETRSTNAKGETETTTHRFHVVAMDLPAFLPDLEVAPETVASRLATAFGAHSLDVESDDFNRRFACRATDLAVGHAILHPRLVERLLAEPAAPPWRIEGTSVLTWSTGVTSVDRVDRRLALLAAIADAVPRHVWLDHGYDPLAR